MLLNTKPCVSILLLLLLYILGKIHFNFIISVLVKYMRQFIWTNNIVMRTNIQFSLMNKQERKTAIKKGYIYISLKMTKLHILQLR